MRLDKGKARESGPEFFEQAPVREITEVRRRNMEIMPQMLYCNQCRAEAVGSLGSCKNKAL